MAEAEYVRALDRGLASRASRSVSCGADPRANGSPVAGGAVSVTDWDTGTLYALNPATGTPVRQASLGAILPHLRPYRWSGRAPMWAP